MNMEAYIKPPEKIPFYIKLGLIITKRVAYWARMLKSLGVPPAGFSDRCEI